MNALQGMDMEINTLGRKEKIKTTENWLMT